MGPTAGGGGGVRLKRRHCGRQPFWLQGAKGPAITAGGGWEVSVLEGVGQEPLANSLYSVPTQKQNVFNIRRVKTSHSRILRRAEQQQRRI